MDWSAILNVGMAIVISFGGAGGIIAIVIKCCVGQITHKLQKKYEIKLNRELERFKNALESKLYVSKTRFDAEFAIYRELSKTTVAMVTEISQLFPSYINNMCDDLESRENRYNNAYEKVVVYQNELAGNAPFIPSEIYILFRNLEDKCKKQLSDFRDFKLRTNHREYIEESYDDYKKAKSRTEEIVFDLDTIIERLRQHLAQLYKL